MAAFGNMGDGGIDEIFVALVANRPVADDHLIKWSAERNLPLTRVYMVDALPKTASGKIHRDLLKRQLLTEGDVAMTAGTSGHVMRIRTMVAQSSCVPAGLSVSRS